MEMMQAILLGAIQGLTEFFPVSSSGHLIIFQQMMGLKEPVLMFDISVHIGTLAAIFLYYFNDIFRILKSWIRSLFIRRHEHETKLSKLEIHDAQMAWMLIAGSFPTALIGAGLKTISDLLFSSLMLVGISLLITGWILLGTRWLHPNEKTDSDISIRQALFIGTIQGLAVIPGISRSGTTISMGLFLGLHRDVAVRYSFLLSIPAIMGALILQLLTESSAPVNMPIYIIASGLISSFIVGYGALVLLVKIVQKGQIYFFTPYCILLGAAVLISGWW